MRSAILILLAYVCGSVPSGVFFARRSGVDIRRSGSGNIGATNVARSAGMRPALLTLLVDVAKGFLPTFAAQILLATPWTVALVGCAAVFGHIFSLFLRFSGGKGVATAAGVYLAIAPGALALSALVFVVVAYWTRYASLASILAAGALPLAGFVLGYPAPMWVSAFVVSTLIIVRHHDNIRRLYRGEEPRFRTRAGTAS